MLAEFRIKKQRSGPCLAHPSTHHAHPASNAPTPMCSGAPHHRVARTAAPACRPSPTPPHARRRLPDLLHHPDRRPGRWRARRAHDLVSGQGAATGRGRAGRGRRAGHDEGCQGGRGERVGSREGRKPDPFENLACFFVVVFSRPAVMRPPGRGCTRQKSCAPWGPTTVSSTPGIHTDPPPPPHTHTPPHKSNSAFP